MITIQEPFFEASTALGRQNPATGVGMRPSKYVIPHEHDGNLLLFNTLTLSLVALPGIAESDWTEGWQNLEDYDELVAGWFIVPVDFDESAAYEEIREIVKLNLTPGSRPGFTILTTTSCNARCFYCYEKGVMPVSIDEKRAAEIVDFMTSRMPDKKVSISWFGGEPLVNNRAIDTISGLLRDRGVDYSSVMTSNGYLFTPALIDKAVDLWNLKTIQITLDGTEKNYNRIKDYVGNPANPYRRVLANIKALDKAGIHVSIRLNWSPDNINDLYALISQLGEELRDCKKVTIYHHIICDYHNDSKSAINEEDFIHHSRRLDSMIESIGKRSHKFLPRSYKFGYCMATNPSSFVITPTGSLTKCEHHTEDEIVGNIYDGITDPALVEKWKESAKSDMCRDCRYNPVCELLKRCPDTEKCDYIQKETRRRDFTHMMEGSWRKYCEKVKEQGNKKG